MKKNILLLILAVSFTATYGQRITGNDGDWTKQYLVLNSTPESCKDYLVYKGVDDGRISIRGFGPDQPIASNDDEQGRRQNRRVEMKITKL